MHASKVGPTLITSQAPELFGGSTPPQPSLDWGGSIVLAIAIVASLPRKRRLRLNEITIPSLVSGGLGSGTFLSLLRKGRHLLNRIIVPSLVWGGLGWGLLLLSACGSAAV